VVKGAAARGADSRAADGGQAVADRARSAAGDPGPSYGGVGTRGAATAAEYLLGDRGSAGDRSLELLDVAPQNPPLLALRLAVGLTLRELAALNGVPNSTYQRLETGTSCSEPPSKTTKGLSISVHQL